MHDFVSGVQTEKGKVESLSRLCSTCYLYASCNHESDVEGVEMWEREEYLDKALIVE
jgi:hypothetical protein